MTFIAFSSRSFDIAEYETTVVRRSRMSIDLDQEMGGGSAVVAGSCESRRIDAC
jgi:hypothetical protein